jgi:hypothetical protein
MLNSLPSNSARIVLLRKPTVSDVFVRTDGRLLLQNAVFDELQLTTTVEKCRSTTNISDFIKLFVASCLCLSRHVSVFWEHTDQTDTLSRTGATLSQERSRPVVYIMQGSQLELTLLGDRPIDEDCIDYEQFIDSDTAAAAMTLGTTAPSVKSSGKASTSSVRGQAADGMVISYKYAENDADPEAADVILAKFNRTVIIDALKPGTAWVRYRSRKPFNASVNMPTSVRSRMATVSVDNDNYEDVEGIVREALIVVIAKPTAISVDIIEMVALMEESYRLKSDVYKQAKLFEVPQYVNIVHDEALMADLHKNWNAFLQII